MGKTQLLLNKNGYHRTQNDEVTQNDDFADTPWCLFAVILW